MTVKVQITDTTTGETRNFPCEYDMELNGFIWREGNFACDCNRGIFFNCAKPSEELPDVSEECGDGRFAVVILDESGKQVYKDGE